MNIFVTSSCPVECARNLCDRRVIKMVLESAQMLSTALREHGVDVGYKSTHKNHPSNVWARETRANWNWLYKHAMALCKEYTKRYNKIHKSQAVIESLYAHISSIPDGNLTQFANCAANQSIGVSYKHFDNVCVAYQLYLNDRWDTDKRTPTWFGEGR